MLQSLGLAFFLFARRNKDMCRLQIESVFPHKKKRILLRVIIFQNFQIWAVGHVGAVDG